ncbi:Deoxyuridine 5'-triphosphate nucleotidohydrolase [Portunus trituberculatus]|uniref:dUTP diphosphatase n=1 Tax=Portunus trituberculatus TaxID=210409 RepID=A0A5B7IA38_PORTR|nr:Deoxyuridine 5'-triphosphate nucleotidohydrolase [Portunus trituberculatus]
MVVPAEGKALVKTDIQVELPEDCYGRVAPRSGLSWKNHIDVGGVCRVVVSFVFCPYSVCCVLILCVVPLFCVSCHVCCVYPVCHVVCCVSILCVVSCLLCAYPVCCVVSFLCVMSLFLCHPSYHHFLRLQTVFSPVQF